MKRFYVVVTGIALVLFMGCVDRDSEKAPEKGAGIEVEWPGGHVELDPEKGVEVKAPGVDVQVEKDKKVGVKAPGVDLQLKREKAADQ